ncbi:MAG: hypothetical protein CVV33_02590 [Methanomicrobiales archaeon HGW-Methanomicrobiales-4]|nr:MAG: hypothetical protein CVV33_02590 [Methanomicrobiales archaeon HGW-Methanomicrobiales-4]
MVEDEIERSERIGSDTPSQTPSVFPSQKLELVILDDLLLVIAPLADSTRVLIIIRKNTKFLLKVLIFFIDTISLSLVRVQYSVQLLVD